MLKKSMWTKAGEWNVRGFETSGCLIKYADKNAKHFWKIFLQ